MNGHQNVDNGERVRIPCACGKQVEFWGPILHAIVLMLQDTEGHKITCVVKEFTFTGLFMLALFGSMDLADVSDVSGAKGWTSAPLAFFTLATQTEAEGRKSVLNRS